MIIVIQFIAKPSNSINFNCMQMQIPIVKFPSGNWMQQIKSTWTRMAWFFAECCNYKKIRFPTFLRIRVTWLKLDWTFAEKDKLTVYAPGDLRFPWIYYPLTQHLSQSVLVTFNKCDLALPHQSLPHHWSFNWRMAWSSTTGRISCHQYLNQSDVHFHDSYIFNITLYRRTIHT